jgi:hypothetical protein
MWENGDSRNKELLTMWIKSVADVVDGRLKFLPAAITLRQYMQFPFFRFAVGAGIGPLGWIG